MTKKDKDWCCLCGAEENLKKLSGVAASNNEPIFMCKICDSFFEDFNRSNLVNLLKDNSFCSIFRRGKSFLSFLIMGAPKAILANDLSTLATSPGMFKTFKDCLCMRLDDSQLAELVIAAEMSIGRKNES